VGKYQTEVAKGIAFEGQAGFGAEFAEKVGKGEWKSAFASVISARLKFSGNVFPGQDAVQWGAEVDISPDECPFGVSLKLAFQTPQAELQSYFPSLPKGLNVQLEGAARFGFGLSQRGWMRLLQVVGNHSLRQAASGLPQQAVRQILLSQIGSASAAAGGAGAAVGVVGFYFGMAWLAATATKGKKLGMLRNYCLGYVTAIFESRPGCRGHLSQMKLRGSSPTDVHFQGGYEDGKFAVQKGKGKSDSIEEVLINKFPVYRMAGSTWLRYQQQVDVGKRIDNEDEVRLIADELAQYLLAHESEIDWFLDSSEADWRWF